MNKICTFYLHTEKRLRLLPLTAMLVSRYYPANCNYRDIHTIHMHFRRCHLCLGHDTNIQRHSLFARDLKRNAYMFSIIYCMIHDFISFSSILHVEHEGCCTTKCRFWVHPQFSITFCLIYARRIHRSTRMYVAWYCYLQATPHDVQAKGFRTESYSNKDDLLVQSTKWMLTNEIERQVSSIVIPSGVH